MLYFRLWSAFLKHCLRASSRSISPISVADSELLGREVFSEKNIKKSTNEVKPGLFMPKEFDRKPISVNRLGFADRSLFFRLGRIHARKRRLTFYGFAELTAQHARQVKGDDGWQMDVRGTPVVRNPFHADLTIQEGKDKSYDLMIAQQICRFARFRGPPQAS